MPSKTEEYLALAQRTANGLTRYWESWTDYLTTASRLYKYSFPDQLMIYAQRPDATACADYDIWNNRMNRYVRRGSKGIALLDQSSNVPRLHYVFDVSDTGVRRNSRDPEVWQLNDDLFQPVSEMLAQEYGIHHERLSQQIADIAGKLAESYWDNNSTDILAIVDGSFLMDYDDAGQELQFKSAAAISIMYTILERCGFEPEGYFDRDDFQAIYDFSTPDAVYALGTAVSECSRDVLRNIERTVKTTIRRRNVERSQHEYEEQERDLLDHRGLPAPEPDPQPAEDSVGQVRQDAPELSEAASPGAVQLDAPERNAIPASDGAGADGREPDAADDDRTAEAEPSPGQGEEPDELGEAHEQPAGANRGNHSDGADLQLSFLDAAIPTEAEQIKNINRAESEKSSSAFVLSQAEIENELRKHGSGFAGGKQRIMALYQTQPDRKLRAKALAKEYGIGGHSHDFLDGSRGFVNHDWKGLEFDHYPDHQKITLKWAQVEKYIDLMIQSDRYLTDEEKEQCTTVQEENGYKVGDDVMVDLPTGTIEGTIGYIGETDVRIDTSAHRQSWDNEVILLVFMFDRIGRIADETPFVVEWFVRNGIRVWSTQEGEQRFDNHTDKLLNYIRFWQADGESEKTSVRTRTSLRQLVEEGHFKGGSAPYGYDLVKSGRINKRKHELYELHINEQEAEIVRLIFDKYVYEGYGAQRIATYLNNAGYRARSGKCWHPGSLRGMVGNLTYMGVLRCGDARSELMPELQIIPQEEFEAAQRIREDRSAHAAEEAEHHVPLRTRGQALLSNNVYCGHCGARLALTTSRKWRKLSDGTLDDTLRIRYTCYGKLRKQTDCTGQTGYTMHILDEIIDKMVRQIFSRLRGIPKEQLITSRYAKETAERKNHLQALQAERDKAEKDLLALKTEILAVIKGESAFPKDTLAEMIAAQEKKHTELETLCEEASAELERNAELMANVSQLYEELISYADLYDSASFEAKKMIVSQLIRRVEVYRGYQIHVDFNFDPAQYLENSDELAC